MRPLLASVVVLGLLTACSSGTEPAPAVTVTAPAPEETVPEGPDPDVLSQYSDLAFEISDTADALSNSDSDAAVLATCIQIGELGQDGLALPDSGMPEVDKYWDQAMSSYAAAGALCASGEFESAVDALSEANVAVGKATDAIG